MRVQQLTHINDSASSEMRQSVGALVEGVLLDIDQQAKAAVDIASDKKASDILLLDIQNVSYIADYFVICSGSNNRQIQSIADAIDDELGKQNVTLLHCEGTARFWLVF